MASGGVKGGTAYGATNELGYRIARDPVRMKEFQSTVLHLLGLDHLRLGYMPVGLKHRLTGVQRHAEVIPRCWRSDEEALSRRDTPTRMIGMERDSRCFRSLDVTLPRRIQPGAHSY